MDNKLLLKHRLIIKDRARYYYLNLSEKNFDMEKTTPRTLILPDDNIKISETSWVHMVIKLFEYLQDNFPKTFDELSEFKVTWSEKLNIFTIEKDNANSHLTKFGYWINCNMTAIHFLWFIGELLEFYGISSKESVLIYHRTPKAEPEEIKQEVIKETKLELRRFLCKTYNMSVDRSEKIIKNMDSLNSFFEKSTSGYNNLFLFDNYVIFNTRQYKMLEEFQNSKFGSSLKNVDMAKRYFKYLNDYYRTSGYIKAYPKAGTTKIGSMVSSKYSCIDEYFSKRTESFIFLTFEDLEKLLDIELPPAAYKYSAFWYPGSHSLPNHFVSGGYDIKVDVKKQLIYLFKINENK